jgi:hypothetical protein
VQPLAEQVDFLRASRDDMAELRRQVFPLARRLATRLTAKRGWAGPAGWTSGAPCGPRSAPAASR